MQETLRGPGRVGGPDTKIRGKMEKESTIEGHGEGWMKSRDQGGDISLVQDGRVKMRDERVQLSELGTEGVRRAEVL